MKMTEPKTKSIGTISADKVKKISGFADYAKAAPALIPIPPQDTRPKQEWPVTKFVPKLVTIHRLLAAPGGCNNEGRQPK
jgi:hypothetical protein